MNGWMTFWTWVYIVGCSLGAVMVLIILPLGVRDLVRLFRLLNTQKPSDENQDGPS